MSRMISQASSLNDHAQTRRVYNTSRAIFLGLGVVSTLLMMVFCKALANSQKQPDAALAIFCLAPSAFLMSVISTYRGFFQGQGNMIPTSKSQVLEAVFKLGAGLAGAVLILYFGGTISMAAAGAILGVTISCAVSVAYLFWVFHKTAQPEILSQNQPGFCGTTAKKLLAIAVPITIGAAGLQLLIVTETSLYMNQLVDLLDRGLLKGELVDALRAEVLAKAAEEGKVLTTAELHSGIAASMKGIYNFGQTIYNLPNSLITPITISIIPAITACLTLGDHKGTKATSESAARITGLLSLPCAVGLMVLSKPIMGLLGHYSGVQLEFAATLLFLLGISVFMRAVVLFTNSLMQANGHANIPVINMLATGVVRMVLVYVLTGNPQIGLVAVPVLTALGNFATAVLNLICLAKVVPQKCAITRNLLRPLLPALLMGAAAFATWQLILGVLGQNCSFLIQVGGPMAVAVVVYVVTAAWLKSITREDCLLLPKGEKIAKLLHL
jgi:stage V sporulation protein B